MQTSSHRLILAAGFLLASSVVAYLPFADVQELRPQELHQFCDPEIKTGLRHCEGTTHRTLEDGGIVGLKWAMHADPDRILSLDLAKEHGVKLLKCTPSSLEIVLPESHAQHARVGELIVASHFVHGCEHLMQVQEEDKLGDEPANMNLYHRVVKVSSVECRNADGSPSAGALPRALKCQKGEVAHAKLWTRELPSLGHAIGSLTYDFQFTPPEAVDPSSFPERRTWDGEDFHEGKWVEKPRFADYTKPAHETVEETARRLNVYDNNNRYEQGPYDNDRDNGKWQDTNGDLHNRYQAGDFQRPTDKYSGANDRNGDIRYRVDGGHPTLGGSTVTNDDVKSLLNFQPKKVANFGWNWDFKVNASQDISFNYTVPGSKMFLVIKKPYIKAHSELRIRFRSYMPNENAEDTFFTDNTWVSTKKHTSKERASIFDTWEPRVKWEASLPGHAQLELGILMQANAQTRVSSNPLELIQIPVLQDFWKPKWFGTLDFSLGNFPVSVTPGIQFKAKFFHYGTFSGSLALGLRTSPRYNPKLQFDSFTGLRVDFLAKLRETTITPPNWLVSTSHFECGLALEPTIWIKGHMGKSTVNTKFAAALRPYFNMTITRAGDMQWQGDNQRELVLYPFRVTGMTATETTKNLRYKARISTRMDPRQCTEGNSMSSYDKNGKKPYTPYSANGNDLPSCEQYKRRVDSTEALSWGDIEWSDPVQRFSFGMIAQRMLLYMQIDIQLIEVDYSSGSPFERASPIKTVRCKTVMNGVCQPSPIIQELYFQSTRLQFFMHAVWKNNPREWFASRIRGVAASVPEVIINKDYIAQIDPDFSIHSYVNQGIVYGKNVEKPLVLVLKHAYKSYPILINKNNGYVPGINSSSMKSDDVTEFGSSFLSTWDRTCLDGTQGCDPKLTLYYGDIELASADIPRIPWNSDEKSTSTYQSIFGNEAYKSRIIPVSVALKASSNQEAGSAVTTTSWQHVGLVRLKLAVANPAAWNRWIRPYQFTAVALGSTYKLVWTLNNADPFKEKKFTMIMMKSLSTLSSAASYQAGSEQKKYMRQRVGSIWFDQISSEAVAIKPINLAGVHRTRFEHVISFNGMVEGDQIMMVCQWVDKFGHVHSMNAPPFVIESKVIEQMAADQAAGIIAPTTTLPLELQLAPASGGRRLDNIMEEIEQPRRLNWMSSAKNWFAGGAAQNGAMLSGTPNNYGWQKGSDGQWNHQNGARHNKWNDRRQCAKRDLNFAFGAGIMVRAYVQHLSLPKDLPILGAIQAAPELGMPWKCITNWRSEATDLASKLPKLLCRHGICSAALPGCSEDNKIQHYYPEVSLHFRKTLRYPHGADKLKAKNQWVEVLRQALSFTFAVMPEFIQILVHYTNKNPVPGTVDTAAAHRRRFVQYHNSMTGTDACENRGYTMAKCATVGCCQFDAPTEECHSAVANGPCLRSSAPGFMSSATFGESAAPAAGVVAPAAGVVAPAAGVVAPVPAVVPGQAVPPAVAPVAAPAVAPVPVVAPVAPVGSPTAAVGAPVAAGPVIAPLQAGPVIAPLSGDRRLRDDGDDDADDEESLDLDEEDLDEVGLDEPRVEKISIRFKNGLKYQVDHELLDAMIKEGLFQQLEEVKTADHPLRIHSYDVKDLNPDSHKGDSDSMSTISAALQSSQRMLLVAAVACGTLLGVAFAIRRARSGYEPVEEDTLLAGPVE